MEDFKDCDFYYDEGKAEWLRCERGLLFDKLADYMRGGWVVDVIDNPSGAYPSKKIAMIDIGNYIVAVPYVRQGKDVFLRTAFKSRKAKKKYGEK